MKADRIVNDLIISRLTAMNSSANANPRWMVVFTDGSSAPTQVDASVAYGLNNPEFKDTPLRVTFNSRGHIVYVDQMNGGRQ